MYDCPAAANIRRTCSAETCSFETPMTERVYQGYLTPLPLVASPPIFHTQGSLGPRPDGPPRLNSPLKLLNSVRGSTVRRVTLTCPRKETTTQMKTMMKSRLGAAKRVRKVAKKQP